MKIGVILESFKLPFNKALEKASGLGIKGVQFYATSGELQPESLTPAKRKELKQQISDYGLEISAVCADFGGHGFQNSQENPERIEKSKKVLDLALELDCRVVTTHIGVIPADRVCERYLPLASSSEELGKYAEKNGGVFAIETGPEPATVLKSFIEDIDCSGLGVNFDPANLVMVLNENIPNAVELLGQYIVHTHAKDGVNLKPVDPVKLYNAFAEHGVDGFQIGDYICEMPLGHGDVDFESYMTALKKTGYDGFLTIEREVGDEPEADIVEAVEFLKKWV